MKNRSIRLLLGLGVLAVGGVFAVLFVNRLQAGDTVISTPEVSPDMSYLDYPLETIDGRTVTLRDFQGKTVLLVNVASKCGFTDQYEGLQALYEEYGEQGFAVIGFPANNFMGQEPGSNEEIQTFCTTEYGVTFPMMAKISVKGDDKHPLYRYLTEESEFSDEISWNFNKFLLNAKGEVVARYGSRDKPRGGELETAIQQQLAS